MACSDPEKRMERVLKNTLRVSMSVNKTAGRTKRRWERLEEKAFRYVDGVVRGQQGSASAAANGRHAAAGRSSELVIYRARFGYLELVG